MAARDGGLPFVVLSPSEWRHLSTLEGTNKEGGEESRAFSVLPSQPTASQCWFELFARSSVRPSCLRHQPLGDAQFGRCHLAVTAAAAAAESQTD